MEILKVFAHTSIILSACAFLAGLVGLWYWLKKQETLDEEAKDD
jgi:hypothetical protein